MINWQPKVLENEIVKIIPLLETDFDNLYKVAADPLIWEQHPTKDRYKKEVFQLYFDSAITSDSAFLIIEKSTNKIIGSTRFYDYKPEDLSIAIGYTFLARQYWGGLYNKATKTLLIDYAFQFVNKIYFHIGATNLRSQLAITKLGAIKIREVNFEHYGEKLVHYEYRILKTEWIHRK